MVQEAVESGRAGHARALLIGGEPGTGKTRLVSELVAMASDRRFRVLAGRGRRFEQPVPYGCLEMFGQAGVDLGEGFWRLLAGADKNLVDRLLGPERGSDLDPVQRARAHVALAEALRRSARDRPVLVVLDDAHWADRATLELFHVLIARSRDSRCLLALAHRDRPPELDRVRAGFFQRLSAEEATTLRLGPLGVEDTQSLASQVLGGAADAALARHVSDQAGGNPFFVVELARSLAATGSVVERGGVLSLAPGPPSRLSAPDTVKAMVSGRLEALGPAATRVAQLVAACGRVALDQPAWRALVAASALSVEEAAGALDSLVGAGILGEVGGGDVEFGHPIVRELIYEGTGSATRRQLHRAMADALGRLEKEGLRVSPLEVAAHVGASAVRGDSAAVEVLVAAGDELIERTPAVAAEWYHRAAEVAGDEAIRAPILAQQSRALLLSGELNEAIAVGRRALTGLPPGDVRALCASTVAFSLSVAGEQAPALEVIDAELGGGRTGHPRLLAHRCAVLMQMGRLDEAEEVGQVALERAGDSTVRSYALGALAQVAALRGDLRRHRSLLDSARREGAVTPRPSQVWLLAAAANQQAWLGLGTEAADLVGQARRARESFGADAYRPAVELAAATVSWLAGDWEEAVARAGAAMEGAEGSGMGLASTWISPVLILVAADRAEVAEARRWLERISSGQAPQVAHSHLYSWAEARLLRLTGQPDMALERLERTLDQQAERGIRLGLPFLLWEAAAAAGESGQRGLAQAHLQSLEALAGELDSPLAGAAANQTRLEVEGDLGAGEAARQAFDALGMAFHVALSDLHLGLVAPEAGRLVGAYRVFESMGADPWRRRAGMGLRRLGEPVPRRSRRRSTDAGLSPLQERIARLVADGLSNREIATTLAVSVRTVENYLSIIYRNSGCRSRAELVAALVSGRIVLDQA